MSNNFGNFGNLGNALGNFLRTSTFRMTNTTNVTLDSVQSLVQETAKEAVKKVKTTASESFFNNDLQLKDMSSADRAELLKDLLKLPGDLTTLLEMISNNAKEQNLKMLAENLDMSKLAALLQGNAKDAINKLVKMIGTLQQQGMQKTEQLTELVKILTLISSSADSANPQMLKNIILLYLPWLPLAQGQNFNFEITRKDENGEDTEDIITIAIETINYGLIKALLSQLGNSNINLKVVCPKEFPKQKLLDVVHSETKDRNIQSKVEVEIGGFIPVETENKKPKINLKTGFAVQPYLVLMAHIVIKTILEIDNNYNLIEKRKEEINNI